MQKINKSHIFTMGLFLAILPYLYLSFFTNPSADDFVSAYLSQTQNFVSLVKDTYLNWNGRYISNILIYLNPLVFGNFLAYKIIPFLIIILIIIANFSFISQLFYGKSRQHQLIIVFVLSLLFFQNMPIISEGIYWFTGSVIYQLGIIVLLFYLAFLIKIIRENKKGFSYVFLTVFLFLASGFNEVLTLLIVFFLSVGTYVFYSKNLANKRIILAQFLLSLSCAAIMIFSLGNEVRGESYQNIHQLSYSFLYSALQLGRFSFLWIVSIPLVAASFLYFLFNKKMREENEFFKNSFYINRWISLSMLFVIIFICVFPAYWATGMLGQHRTLNVAYFFFLIIWFINLTVWFNYYQDKIRLTLSNKIKTSLYLVLIIGFVFTGNGYNGLNDIFSGKAKQYNIQLNSRYKLLQNKKNSNKNTLVLPKLTAHPRCLFVSDITEQPSYWTNQAYNLYFRLEERQVLIQEVN